MCQLNLIHLENWRFFDSVGGLNWASKAAGQIEMLKVELEVQHRLDRVVPDTNLGCNPASSAPCMTYGCSAVISSAKASPIGLELRQGDRPHLLSTLEAKRSPAMVNALPAPQNLVTDTWVTATWEEFLVLVNRPEFEQAQCYYDAGWMRIETMPIGFAHGRDNSLLASIVSLYGTLKNLPFLSVTNGSFRQEGERECQPDLAFYLGPELPSIPRSNSPVDVNQYGAPTLAIEVAATTLSDDLGQKRLLYERLGIQEYWVVNVEAATLIAFAIADGGSRQIQVSAVLPGLAIAVIEEALRRSQAEDDGAVNRWLLQQFSS